jgi:hypothetical protein
VEYVYFNNIAKAKPQYFFRPEMYDRALVHAIESVIIDWTHQIKEVLKKDSAQPLLEGLNPTPFVEVEFWKAKAQNLECIYDQVCTQCIQCLNETHSKHISGRATLRNDQST